MAEAKTQPTQASVADFIDAVPDDTRREDARAVVAMMQHATGAPPVLWGPSIIGFGSYRYRYESGREGEMCRIGFSPRKAELVFYLLSGDDDEAALLGRLGKHRVGKGCLYVKRLADIDRNVLETMITRRVAIMDARYPR